MLPHFWKAGDYDTVVDYCLKDSQLVYDLWKYGQENGIVKGFSVEQEEFVDLELIGDDDLGMVRINFIHAYGFASLLRGIWWF